MLRIENSANVGAYAVMTGVAIQLLIGPWVQTSVYDIPLIDFHFTGVMTNTSSTGAYRGAGRPEAIYNIERLMDEAARQTGIDRIALRRRNFVQPAQMPYTNPMGQVYDSGRFEAVMDQALALVEKFCDMGYALPASANWPLVETRPDGFYIYGKKVVEVDDAVDTLIGLIEPIMIIVLGLGVGTLLVSVLVPIYNIASSIS